MLGVDTVMRGNEIRGEYRESSHVWLPSKLPFRERAYIRYTHSAPFNSSGCHPNYQLEIVYIQYTHAAPFHTSGFHLKYHLELEPT